MQLIAALAAGIRGAENGYAQLFVRGTTTRATWYSSFEADGQDSSGQNIQLGSSGEVVVYVNQVVDVVVKTSAGATVRQFTAGEATTAIEVISRSFTGTDYVTAASGHTKPVDLATVLGRWHVSAGDVDWKVLDGAGNSRTLQSIASIFGNIFVVKDAAYGATGDGETDDTAAIQACLTAAGDAGDGGGAIVFFPPGAYSITSALTVPAGVSLMGSGPTASHVVLDSATEDILDIAAIAGGFTELSSLHLLHAQESGGRILDIASGASALVRNCRLGSANAIGATLRLQSATSRCTIKDSDIVIGGTTGSVVTSAGTVEFDNVRLTIGNAAWVGSAIIASATRLHKCTFNVSVVTATGGKIVDMLNPNTVAVISDCGVTDEGSGGEVTFVNVGSLADGSVLYERGGLYLNTKAVAVASGIYTGVWDLGFRKGRIQTLTGGSTTDVVTLDALNHGTCVVYVNGSENFNLSISPTEMPPGAELDIVLINTTESATGDIDISTGNARMQWSVDTVSIPTQTWAASVRLRTVPLATGNTVEWMQIGDAWVFVPPSP